MKVLLVNPPRSPANAILRHAPPEARRYVHRKLVGPPLGLVTVAAAVRDHDVSVLEIKGEQDLFPEGPPPERLLRASLESFRPRVLGITFIASEYDAGMALFREAKRWDPSVVTVAGGLHATLCPEDFGDPAVDVVVPGEGALTFRDLVASIESGRPVDAVGGILVRDDGRLRPSRTPAPLRDPAGRDFVAPDRALLKRWISTYRVGPSPVPVTYLYTSLGCPYRCSFCSIWPQFAGHFHRRDVESVVAELSTLEEYDIVRFADANTLADTAYAERLFDRILEAGIRKTFVIDLRMDTAAENPALIEKAARAGFRVGITGFESPRPEELRGYNKNLEVWHIREGLRVCHANGVHLRANFVVPPDYAGEDFAALAEFAAAHATAYAGYTILTPMPGTALHAELRDRIVDRDLSKYNFFNAVLRTRLPVDEFHARVGALWSIRAGDAIL